MKNYIYILLAAMFFVASCGEQKEQKEDELSRNLTKLDELSGDYEPMQTGDLKTYHLAVKGRYEGGVWKMDSMATYMRPGRLPYGAASSGELQVTYTDANGKELGKYLVEHPGKMRSCEGGEPKATVMDNFEFEILLPGREDVRGVSLSQGGKVMQEFKVPVRMMRDERPTTVPGANDTSRVK